MKNQDKAIHLILIYLILAAAFLFLGIIFGSLNTEIGNPALEISHQILVGLGSGFLLIGFAISVNNIRHNRLMISLISTAMLFVGVQVGLGQFLIRNRAEYWVSGILYGLSVTIIGLIVGSIAYLSLRPLQRDDRLKFLSSFSRQTILGVFLGYIVLLSGVYLAISGNRYSCMGWPLCDGGSLPNDLGGWIVLIHRMVVGAVGLYLLWFNQQAWAKQKSQRLILTVSNLFVVLYFAQGFVGALKTIRDFPVYLLILHDATAVSLIAIGFVLLIAVGMKSRTEEEEIGEASQKFNRKQKMKDLLAINKPVVVLLLLSTTIAGMVIGAGKLPSFDILIVTILGGFLAAGGSSAINQYIDRDLDSLMTRTAKRPIPAGRLTPAEGLAFGVTALVIAFYLLAGFVNILAALLALAGMVYYILIYSVYLKKRSVQNIVIGGGAGAIPPLVGWAAATGSLNLAAGFLFLIIFLWTPPHFWALALLRKNEYAAAGVPMMPVERGDEVTKKLIFQYSVVLVFSTLTFWFLGLGGWIYFAGSTILGLYLLYLARQVMVNGRNRTYHRMYKHSNYYLLLLFIVLAADSVLL